MIGTALLRCLSTAHEGIGTGKAALSNERTDPGGEKMGIPISGMLPVYLESRHELIGFLDAPGAVCGEATITVRGDGRDIVLGVLRFVRERTGGDVLRG
jgi:hypothetical protein